MYIAVYADMIILGKEKNVMPFFMAEGASDLSGFLDTIKAALGEFTTTNLATILVATLGLTGALAVCWFGYRFITRKVAGAIKKGTI